MENEKRIDWEKIGVYLVIGASLASLFFYIADMKERTRALEVKVEKLEQK
jgi:nucleoside permease NupC